MTAPSLIGPRGHYAHTTIHAGVVYIAEQLPVTPAGEVLADRPFDVQARQVLQNLDCCLTAAAGTSRDQLLSVTAYVIDMADWPQFDAAYAEWLGSHRPARAVAGAASLHYGAAVEGPARAAMP